MQQSEFVEILESELSAAILNSDKEAIKRVSLLLNEKISQIENLKKEHEETKSDIKMLIEVVKQGFEHMNKRFEDLQRYMEKRFEAVDKRFEDMQKYMNRRFEDMNKRFDMMFKFMALGYSIITLLIVIFKFIK